MPFVYRTSLSDARLSYSSKCKVSASVPEDDRTAEIN
jgi:hypothetical protein